MSRHEPTRRILTRLLAGLGVASGLALLVRPQQVLDAVAPAFPQDRRWLVRVLGARLIGQHVAVLVAPRRPLVRLGAAVDLAHAASMVPFLASRRYGRAARVSGGAAVAAAVLGATAAAGAAPART